MDDAHLTSFLATLEAKQSIEALSKAALQQCINSRDCSTQHMKMVSGEIGNRVLKIMCQLREKVESLHENEETTAGDPIHNVTDATGDSGMYSNG